MINELQPKSNTVIYNDGELELNVSVENETVWLAQKQIAEFFENRTIQKYLIVQKGKKKSQKRSLRWIFWKF